MCAVALASPSFPRLVRPKVESRDQARETERQLLIRYHRKGDLAAREELAERFLPLARDLALRYTYTDEPFDDLLQVASLGLIKAIDRFDPEPRDEVHELRRADHPGRAEAAFPRQGLGPARAARPPGANPGVNRATESLSKQLGRSPKVREVAAELGCSIEKVLEAQEAAASYEAASLDAPTSRDDDEAASLVDLMGDVDSAYDLVESRDAIASTWKALPESGAQGARAALHARPDAARDRRADRLLADARLTAAAAGPRPSGDGCSRRLSERRSPRRSPPSRC